jgi:hypothetical protein
VTVSCDRRFRKRSPLCFWPVVTPSRAEPLTSSLCIPQNATRVTTGLFTACDLPLMESRTPLGALKSSASLSRFRVPRLDLKDDVLTIQR